MDYTVVVDHRAAIFVWYQGAKLYPEFGRIITESAIGYGRAAVLAVDSPTVFDVTIGNCKAIQNRIGIFAAVKIESPSATLAIDYSSFYNVGFIRVDASNRNGLSAKVDVTVAGAGICAGGNKNYITICTGVDSVLNGGVLIWNQASLCWCQSQENQGNYDAWKNYFFHVLSLSKFMINIL
jgi:hypothetical protein